MLLLLRRCSAACLLLRCRRRSALTACRPLPLVCLLPVAVPLRPPTPPHTTTHRSATPRRPLSPPTHNPPALCPPR